MGKVGKFLDSLVEGWYSAARKYQEY